MDKTVKVQVKNIASAPQKARLVADMVRGMNVAKAIDVLSLTNKKAALDVKKALVSGVANAKTLLGVEKENLVVSKLSIDEGKKQRKVNFGSRGRVSMMTKRKSHINLELKVK
ncbi:MAG TPA: 50S ribosomal protein L22 [Candidatus Dojkabacteria bacterium]|nr:50S ribosomal protein L22 [Candidatus Dojkabacteria bacterium]